MKEITLLVGSLAGGGAEGVCVSVANGLSKIGYSVTVVVLNLDNAVNRERLNHRVRLVSLNVSNVRYSFVKLFSFVKNNDLNTVLVFDHLLASVILLVKYLSLREFLIVARNINTLSQELSSYDNVIYSKLVNLVVNFTYRRMDFVINQSSGMMEDLICLYPELTQKTTYIHNPVNEKVAYASEQSQHKPPGEKKYLLCVGRLESQKAWHIAINSFSELIKCGYDFRLKLVGIGKLESELKQQCIRLGINDKVDFEGFQKDVSSYFESAKATLLTSKYEGFPNVLVESITMGTPVLSFDCPSGPKEIIVDSTNGFLVDYMNEIEFTKHLKIICDKDFDPVEVKSTANKYRIETVVNKYHEVFKKIQ
ncbi:glycosyl transferase group 1 [Vibrio diabolicus E0666]|nr:glycosyl transferase group 1 [Vibrio diabolicus E0666]